MPDTNSIEKLVVIAKPESGELSLVPQIIRELEGLGLTVIPRGPYDFFGQPGKAEEFYAGIAGKPYFRKPVLAIQRGTVHVLLVQGYDAVQVVREWLGPTDIEEALRTSSFRGRMLREHGFPEKGFFKSACNFVHASSSAEDGEREAKLLFPNQP